MRILVDINHPAHVHFFKHFIWEMQERHHQILITASSKDLTFELLNKYKLNFIDLGAYGKSTLRKLVYIPIIDFNLMKATLTFRPDVLMGIASFRASHVGFLTGRKSYIFDDTEHASKILYKSFATKIFTPDCFTKSISKKQIRYRGYHELSYLHPNYFNPQATVLDDLALDEREPFFIVRFVSWKAVHDIGHTGMSDEGKDRLIKQLSEYGKVILTSEDKLPDKFEKYRMNLSSEMMHHMLYFASMYVGEGGTMATEAAVLGTPSVFISSLDAGTFKDLEHNYKLLYRFSDENKAMIHIEKLLKKRHLKDEWQVKRQHLLNNKIDVTKWMIDNVEDAKLIS